MLTDSALVRSALTLDSSSARSGPIAGSGRADPFFGRTTFFRSSKKLFLRRFEKNRSSHINGGLCKIKILVGSLRDLNGISVGSCISTGSYKVGLLVLWFFLEALKPVWV